MIRVWGRRTSGRTLKALWAMTEAGLDYELTLASATMGPDGSVAKGSKPYGIVDTPEYRAMNPTGRVPTIDDDGFILWEVNSIVRYIALAYAPLRLYGGDIRVFSSASRWLDWENTALIPWQTDLAVQLYRVPEDKRDKAVLDRAIKESRAAFGIVDAQLSKTRHICGEDFTIGDIALAVHVHRWYLAGLDEPSMPHLDRWYREIQARPAFQKEVAEPSWHTSA